MTVIFERRVSPQSSDASIRAPSKPLAAQVAGHRRSCSTNCSRIAERLEGATPQEIIAWAVEKYFPKLTMATAFGPEGCVIIHMLAEIEPRTHVFNLDTGYQFKETLELRDRIAQRYGIEVELKQPTTTVESTKPSTAARCTRRIPTSAASIARSQCCARRPSAWNAWMSGIRRDQSPDRAKAPIVGWDKKFGLVKISPLGQLDQERRLEADHRRKHSLQPAARSGLHEHRLLALHAGGDVRRRRTGRPLERHCQDRVRPAHDRRLRCSLARRTAACLRQLPPIWQSVTASA